MDWVGQDLGNMNGRMTELRKRRGQDDVYDVLGSEAGDHIGNRHHPGSWMTNMPYFLLD